MIFNIRLTIVHVDIGKTLNYQKKDIARKLKRKKTRRITRRKNRADKLDEGFLFLISLTSVIFMIIQTFLSGVSFLLYAIPLLVLGVGLPFYFGYWKGALENSVIMRVRGWIYLYFGTFGYVIYIVYSTMKKILPFGSYIQGVILTLFTYISGKFIFYKILPDIFEKCGEEVSPIDEKIAGNTNLEAFLVLFLLFFYVESISNPKTCQGTVNPTICFLITYLGFPLFFLFLLAFYEKDNKRLLEKYKEPYYVVMPRKDLLEKHKKSIGVLILLSQVMLLVSSVVAPLAITEKREISPMMLLFIALLIITMTINIIVSIIMETKIVFEK
jgi:hypothetical protein